MTSLFDPSIATGIGLSVLGCQDSLNRLLGPSADYLGVKLKGVIEKCDINLDRVLNIALRKLGNRIETTGAVSPRVLKHLVDEARFCEDEIVAAYLGGVLASSRANGDTDDRGVSFLSDIQSLSSFQLRTHCMIYRTIPQFANSIRFNPTSAYGADSHETITLIFNDDSYLNALNCPTHLRRFVGRHSFLGLNSRRLCDGGDIAYQNHAGDDSPPRVPWRTCYPTLYGHELFLWGTGLGDFTPTSYFDLPVDLADGLLPALDVVEVDLGRKYVIGAKREY